MLTTLGLVLSLATGPRMTAVHYGNDLTRQYLQVTVNGKVHVVNQPGLKENLAAPPMASARRFRNALQEGLVFKGDKFKIDDRGIVNERTGDTLSIPGGLEGGTVLDTGMLLLYTGSNEGMVPPITSGSAVVVEEHLGKLVRVKNIDVSAAVRGAHGVMAFRRPNELIVWSLAGFGAIDLRTLQFKLLHTGDSVMGGSGRLYWQDDDVLKEWSWNLLKWRKLGHLDEYDWRFGYPMRADDLLVSDGAVALAHACKIYRVWPADNRFRRPLTVFVDRKLGVGVTTGWGAGAFLSPKDLSVLCRISAKPE